MDLRQGQRIGKSVDISAFRLSCQRSHGRPHGCPLLEGQGHFFISTEVHLAALVSLRRSREGNRITTEGSQDPQMASCALRGKSGGTPDAVAVWETRTKQDLKPDVDMSALRPVIYVIELLFDRKTKPSNRTFISCTGRCVGLLVARVGFYAQ
ncbi:hypothetical protein EI94DRAFT_1748339 [Lactarius quietus]|nr:hypothetical protein EI94DRAFT_1748339 [Lactarius quietus]